MPTLLQDDPTAAAAMQGFAVGRAVTLQTLTDRKNRTGSVPDHPALVMLEPENSLWHCIITSSSAKGWPYLFAARSQLYVAIVHEAYNLFMLAVRDQKGINVALSWIVLPQTSFQAAADICWCVSCRLQQLLSMASVLQRALACLQHCMDHLQDVNHIMIL